MGYNKRMVQLTLSVVLVLLQLFFVANQVSAIRYSVQTDVESSFGQEYTYNGITISVDNNEYEGKGMIQSLDYDNKGSFAIAFDSGNTRKDIVVYNCEGELIFHVYLNEPGGIRLAFDNHTQQLRIYLVRQKVVFTLNESGYLISKNPIDDIPKDVIRNDGSESFESITENNQIFYLENLFIRSLDVRQDESCVFYKETNTKFSKVVLACLFSVIVLYALKNGRKRG